MQSQQSIPNLHCVSQRIVDWGIPLETIVGLPGPTQFSIPAYPHTITIQFNAQNSRPRLSQYATSADGQSTATTPTAMITIDRHSWSQSASNRNSTSEILSGPSRPMKTSLSPVGSNTFQPFSSTAQQHSTTLHNCATQRHSSTKQLCTSERLPTRRHHVPRILQADEVREAYPRSEA